jgi:hypothetical protein
MLLGFLTATWALELEVHRDWPAQFDFVGVGVGVGAID